MSRSTPTLTQNPSTRFFEFKAKKGEVQYFDKSIGENGDNVSVPTPFRFLYLDSVYQITGGKKIGKRPNQEYIGYFSNAVKNLKDDHFVVRDKAGIIAEGNYATVKQVNGVKLMVGLYVAYYDDNKTLQIGYLKLKGSAMGEWWDFCKGKNVETGAISLTRGEKQEDEEGNVYYLPAFSYSANVSDEANQAAIELDVQLQTYLKTALGKREEVVHDEVVVNEDQAFVAAASTAITSSVNATQVQESDTHPLDDDIPF